MTDTTSTFANGLREMDVIQLADYLGVTPARINTARKNGGITSYTQSGRAYIYHYPADNEYIAYTAAGSPVRAARQEAVEVGGIVNQIASAIATAEVNAKLDLLNSLAAWVSEERGKLKGSK